MSDKSLNDSSIDGDVSTDVEIGSRSTSNSETVPCAKLELPQYIDSFYKQKELIRELDTLKCDQDVLESVVTNYIIVKKILQYVPWQEKVLCRVVCSTWNSAVKALQKEQLSPQDFSINMKPYCFGSDAKATFKKSGEFYSEPLAVLTFGNHGCSSSCECRIITPCPCSPMCKKEHNLVDIVNHYTSAPKNCMLTVKSNYLSYMPLPHSDTFQNMITYKMFLKSSPYIGGIYIPKIPNVEFHVINIRSMENLQRDFYSIIDGLATTKIFRGVLAYVTEKYILQCVEDIVFLNYFKQVQPDTPYALGGCIIDDTIHGNRDITSLVEMNNDTFEFTSENLITVALFTVPKADVDSCHFDMYSLVIDSTDWAKAKILKTITEFSNRVPRFEHSVALKLSCVGRDQKHELEQDYFRAAFPSTRIIGCYGNGELGISHPVLPPSHSPFRAKRAKDNSEPQYGIMYSYSTIFVYMGWGKITSRQGP